MPDPATCYHCGLPAGPDTDYTLQRADEVLRFCCPGCRAVAGTIIGGGLARYYEYRDFSGEQGLPGARITPSSEPQDFRRFDRVEFQRGFVQHSGDACSALINIDGISCAACTWLIEQRLGRETGIERIHVNLSKHRATVHWQAQQIPLSTIFALIHSIGYTPSPYTPEREEQLLEKEQREALKRLGVAGLGMMQVGMFAIALHAGALQGMDQLHRDFLRLFSLIIATAVVFYAAKPFFQGAWRSLRNHSPGMDVPVSLAIGLAYGASCWATLSGSGEVYFDSVSMFTFFLLGSRYLEMRARHRNEYVSRGIKALQAPYAWRLEADADDSQLTNSGCQQVPCDQLQSGDKVLIKPGEMVPADGVVIAGRSSVDESIFSGEYLPVTKRCGDAVVAGSINADGLVAIRVSATELHTRLGVITRLLERAQAYKPRSAQLADRLASVFVMVVLCCAGAAAVYWWMVQPEDALWIALSVLVVSCPCALSLATPTALTAALSQLKRFGVLLSRGDVLQVLPAVTTVVFDKTGTLTTGKLELRRTTTLGSLPELRCLAIAAAIEQHSNHPIAGAFAPFAVSLGSLSDITRVQDAEVLVGQGIAGTLRGERYFIGAAGWIESILPSAMPYPDALTADAVSNGTAGEPSTHVVLASEEEYLAVFELQDAIRPGAADALTALHQRGLTLRMLSGDPSAAVEQVAAALTLDDYQGGLSPQQKLATLRHWQDRGERIMMVGDGINDVPVLAAADLSVAVVNATALAKASADCLLLSGDLNGINQLLETARQTRRIVKQNLAWSLLYNLSAIPLAAGGHVPPWLAALGMSASSLVVVANAMRLNSRSANGTEPTATRRPPLSNPQQESDQPWTA